MIAIKVDNLSRKFKLYSSPKKRLLEYLSIGRIKEHTDFWAIKDVSFEIETGSTVGIIGQNGSGKSTLLSILAGVLPLSEGSCQVNGKVSAILELGSGFHPEFSGRDNVYMYGSIIGLSKEEIDEKFDEILHFSELGDFIDQPLRTYSSGMIVRLAFSVAVNVNSDILIVDEALAVGDAIFQHRCFRKIKEMQAEGKTILYVGHDTEAVRNLCNYAMLLDGGRIIERGDVNMVVNKYHALITQRERMYNEVNLEEQGEVLKDGYDIVYNFINNLKNARKKSRNPDHIREQVVEVKSVPRKIIFAHAPSEIEYDLVVEPGSSLAFGIGLLPGAGDKLKGGVQFEIKVKCDGVEKNIFSRTIEPKKNPRDRGWHNFKIGLSDFEGKDVKIELITSGNEKDFSYHWSAWGWPSVVKFDSKTKDKRHENSKDETLEDLFSQSSREVRYGNKKAEIIKVELLDENGQSRQVFKSGELAIINMEVLLNYDIDAHLVLGILIRNKFGDVYGIHTRGYGLDFGKRKKGNVVKARFSQRLKLVPGIYSLANGVSIASSDYSFEILDRKYDWIFFKIESDKKFSGCVDLEATIEKYD